MPVWLIANILVESATVVGGILPSNGVRSDGSRVVTSPLADPFVNIHTDAGSPGMPIDVLAAVESFCAVRK